MAPLSHEACPPSRHVALRTQTHAHTSSAPLPDRRGPAKQAQQHAAAARGGRTEDSKGSGSFMAGTLALARHSAQRLLRVGKGRTFQRGDGWAMRGAGGGRCGARAPMHDQGPVPNEVCTLLVCLSINLSSHSGRCQASGWGGTPRRHDWRQHLVAAAAAAAGKQADPLPSEALHPASTVVSA